MKNIKSISHFGLSTIIKALIIGTISGCIILFILMLVISGVLMICGLLPHDSLIYFAMFSYSISSYIASYITASIIKKSGIIWGGEVGLILFIIQFIIGLTQGESSITYITLVKLILFLIVGCIGGIKAVNKKDKIRIK